MFIVHSGKAKPAAEELYQSMEGREGCRVFLDKEKLREGESWPAELDQALRSSRVAVVLVTPTVLSAFYAIEEIQRAIGLMRSLGAPLIVPVYLDGTSPSDAPYGLLGLQSLTVPVGAGPATLADRLLDLVRRVSAEPVGPAPAGAPASGPAELVVDQRGGSGTYSSIRRALANAGPESRILIRPGLYEETLTITQPVHLVGDGPAESVILQSFNATTITWACSSGSIEGLTIRQQGGTFSYQSIDIAAGMPVIRRCLITGGTRSCIRARGTSTPEITANIITGTAAVGVELGDFTSPQVTHNWIFGLSETGIWVGGRAHPMVRDNVVEDCIAAGVWAGDESRTAIVATAVRECGVGLSANGRSYLNVSFSEIRSSRGSGVVFRGDSSGALLENLVTESGHAQIRITTTGSPTFENNSIVQGRADGVLIDKASEGEPPTFVRNHIAENQWSGAFLRSQAIAKFRENYVAGNCDNGFTIHDGAAGDFESNLVVDNGQNGVSMHAAGAAELSLNRVRGNSWAGLYVSACSPRCDRNQVYDNPWGAVSIANGGSPKLKENDLSAKDNAALLVTDTDGAVVELNRIHGSEFGVDIRKGTINISSNTIDENRLAVRVGAGTQVTFEGNSLAGNIEAIRDPGSRLDDLSTSDIIEVLEDEERRQRTPVFLHRLEELDPVTWGATARSAPAAGLPLPPPPQVVLEYRDGPAVSPAG